jgi:hypothetical protein
MIASEDYAQVELISGNEAPVNHSHEVWVPLEKGWFVPCIQ